jgi:hypothetical protein
MQILRSLPLIHAELSLLMYLLWPGHRSTLIKVFTLIKYSQAKADHGFWWSPPLANLPFNSQSYPSSWLPFSSAFYLFESSRFCSWFVVLNNYNKNPLGSSWQYRFPSFGIVFNKLHLHKTACIQECLTEKKPLMPNSTFLFNTGQWEFLCGGLFIS